MLIIYYYALLLNFHLRTQRLFALYMDFPEAILRWNNNNNSTDNCIISDNRLDFIVIFFCFEVINFTWYF